MVLQFDELNYWHILAILNEYSGLILLLGPTIIILAIAAHDLLQTKHTIRRNFPVIGIARYLLEFIGPELRQYLFHDERSDRPIPRYIRSWVYAHSKQELATVAFGTKKDIDKPGTLLIKHSFFPVNEIDGKCNINYRILIGEKRKYPYEASLFNISAMSYGALGRNAVLALNHGARVANCFHNTGEGGISSYHKEGGGDLVMQIGTAKFGVRDEFGRFSETKFLDLALLDQIKMFEVKLSQGAKPGKGGVLPKEKVTAEIAEIRGIPIGQDAISPPRHSEWEDVYGMLEWISYLQYLSGKPVGIKFCLGQNQFVSELVRLMVKTRMMPDFISIDGAEGATGAAPLAHTDYLGYPLKDALMFIDNELRINGLRDDIKLIASGKVITGADLAIILALGADLAQSARGFMLSIGCIHALKCNTNHCPAGLATHDEWLQRGLVVKEKFPRVANYHKAVLSEFTSVMHACGYHYPSEFKRSDIMKVVDFHKIISMDEIVPQPPKQACAGLAAK
jgi:glutamate synthase domain-containing protein 2